MMRNMCSPKATWFYAQANDRYKEQGHIKRMLQSIKEKKEAGFNNGY